MPIKIAGAQIGSRWEDPQKSLQKAEPFIRKAVDDGASLICFPEQYPTGWDPRSVRHVEERDGRSSPDSATLHRNMVLHYSAHSASALIPNRGTPASLLIAKGRLLPPMRSLTSSPRHTKTNTTPRVIPRESSDSRMFPLVSPSAMTSVSRGFSGRTQGQESAACWSLQHGLHPGSATGSSCSWHGRSNTRCMSWG